MPHPAHRGLRPGGPQSPDIEPALHLTYLGLLGEGDVGGERADLVAVGLEAHDLHHLHRLGVVDHHVAGEASLWGVVAG
jgi:hypothetical protein